MVWNWCKRVVNNVADSCRNAYTELVTANRNKPGLEDKPKTLMLLKNEPTTTLERRGDKTVMITIAYDGSRQVKELDSDLDSAAIDNLYQTRVESLRQKNAERRQKDLEEQQRELEEQRKKKEMTIDSLFYAREQFEMAYKSSNLDEYAGRQRYGICPVDEDRTSKTYENAKNIDDFEKFLLEEIAVERKSEHRDTIDSRVLVFDEQHAKRKPADMIDKQFAIITRYGTFHKDALLKALSEEGRKQLYSIWGVAEKKAEPQLVYAGVN